MVINCQNPYRITFLVFGLFSLLMAIFPAFQPAPILAQGAIPNTPSNLQVVGVTQSSVTIGWTDNSNNEQGFNIYRWNGSTFAFYASVAANVVSFTDSGRPCEWSDFYMVSAFNSVGESAQIGWVIGTTTSCATPPVTPSNLTVVGVTQYSITIGWTDNSNNEQGFKIYKWNGADFTYFASVGADTTTFTHTGLDCETSDFYKVSAYNSYGESEQVGYIEGRTGTCTQVDCSAFSNQPGVILFKHGWCNGEQRDFTTPGIYNLADFSNLASAAHVGSGWSVKVYSLPDLQGSSRCLAWPYWNFDWDLFDDGSPMNDTVDSIQVYDNSSCGVPDIPANLQASNGIYPDKVIVTWGSSPGATGYEVWRHTSDNPSSATRIASSVSTTRFDDTSAVAGVTYYYWVKAKNSSGASEFSVVDSGYLRPQSLPENPRWKILVLIYDSTDFSYTDDLGNGHRVVATMTQAEIDRAANAATRFFEEDVPALTSGNMYPRLTIRYPTRTLNQLDTFCGYWPSMANTAPELDPAFDSVVVIWDSSGTDLNTGQPAYLQNCGGLTPPNGTGQTYSTFQIDSVSANQRNVFKHEWGHSITDYFDAAGSAPKPAVNNHINNTDTQYVHCAAGEPYILEDETDDNPISTSIYNNEVGFTHDYYSGTTATPDQPARCLGITPPAWATGGPVTKPAQLTFQVNPDGFSFSNFNYRGANWDQFKKAFPDTQMELPDGTHRKGPQVYFDNQYKTIGEGGNCAGFTAASLVHYLGLTETVELSLLTPAHRNISPTYNLPAVVDGDVQPGQSDVKDYIHLYQARQMSYQYAQWWGQHGDDTPLQTYQAIKTKTQAGEPVAVSIYQAGRGGHRVTAYQTEESGNTGYIYVYDNNWPNNSTRRIQINLSTGQWLYTLWDGETWGGTTNLRYSPATINFPAALDPNNDQGAILFPSASSNDTLLSVNGQAQLLITDSQGHKVGYENGNFVNEIPGAAIIREEGFNPADPGATGVEMFYLPAGTTYHVAVQPKANTGSYNLTAYGGGSALLLSNITLITNTIDTLTLNGNVLNTTFDPATDKDFCHYITQEVSGTSSRDFKTCVSSAGDIKANFTLISPGNGLQFVNQSGQTVTVQATINQVGEGAGTNTVHQQVSAGQGITIQAGGAKTYLPIVIK